MKVFFTLISFLCVSAAFGQNLSYQGVTYFSEDVDSKQKSEQYYSHNGLIKVLETDKKITTPSSIYYIQSKNIENGVVVYHCTGRDTFMNEVPIKIEYDRFYQRVKISNEGEMAEANYSVYFLVK